MQEQNSMINQEIAQLTDEHVDGYVFSHITWKSFKAYGPHFHNFYEIIICRKNASRFSIAGHIYDVHPYDMFVVPPHQVHHMISQSEMHDYERICIYLTKEMIVRLCMDTTDICDLIDAAGLIGQAQYMLQPQEYNHIVTLVSSMHSVNYNPSANTFDQFQDMHIAGYILSIVCRVLQKKKLSYSTQQSAFIRSVASYIDEHHREALTLEVIAQHFSVSKYYLSHAFSEVIGTSIHQYLLICRISEAKEGIRTGMSIAEAAFKSGFSDYSVFLRAFIKMTDETPSVFRERFLRLQEMNGMQ